MSLLIAIGLGGLCAAAGCQRHPPAPAAGGSWTTFHDSAPGYSFRYPSDLRVTRPPLASFGIAGLVGAVELTAPGPERLVLRVLVVDVPGGRASCAWTVHVPGARVPHAVRDGGRADPAPPT